MSRVKGAFVAILAVGVLLAAAVNSVAIPLGHKASGLMPTSGLVAYWSFDEASGSIVHDYSGNGYDGTIHGALWTEGKYGSGLEFDGVGNYVDILGSAAIQYDSMTVCAWVKKRQGFQTERFILGKHHSTISGGWFLEANNSRFAYYYGYDPRVFTPQDYDSSWHFVVGVCGKDSISIYVDGNLRATNTTSWLGGSAENVQIGRAHPGTHYWHGTIDEVRIYNKVLSDKEIFDLYVPLSDVRALSILTPMGIVKLDSLITPLAVVKNVGQLVATFPVIFAIGSNYADTAYVTDTLRPGDVDTVSFSAWIPDTVGSFGVRCYTDLPTDEYRVNDTIKSVVAVVADTAAPIVYSVAPNAGGNVGSVITTIHGQRFSQGVSVRLICFGETDVVVDSAFISVVDSTTIIAGLVLAGKPLRSWDIVVTNPDQRSGVLRDGFQTLIGQRGLWTDIVSRDNLTSGRSGDFTVLIGNSGNVDAYGVVLELGGIPADVSIWPTFEMGYPDARPEGWDSVSWADYPDFFIDSTGYSPSGLKDKSGYPALLTQFDALYLPVIPLHTTYSLRFGINNPSAGVMKLYLLRPQSMEYLMAQDNAQFISNSLCFVQILYEGLKVGFPYLTQELGSCVGDLTKQTVSVLSTLPIRWARGNISGVKAKPQSLIQTLGAAGMSVLGSCVGVIPGGGASVIVLKGTAAAYSGYRSGQAIEASCTELFGLIQLVTKEIVTNLPPRPIDPNDKAGPTGHGALHHIPIEQQLQYVIYFENVDTATADARDVEIVDSLSSGLDWSTLSFGEVFPGAGPDGIRPDFAYTTNFNPATGVISWNLNNINLPPDTMPYWGEGWVSYSIKPKSDLSSGTRIDNIAAIRFDVYDWILAPMDSMPIFNTIDAGAPTSSVSSLPDTTRGRNFMVHWTGVDEPNGSGIGSYSIYVSTDSGPYDLWISSTPLDTTTYPGSASHSYSFYSIARDNVGHVETKLPTSEAKTTVTYMCGDADGDASITIADVVFLIDYIFRGGAAPEPVAVGDADCSGSINIADVVYLVNYIFSHGPQPCAWCK